MDQTAILQRILQILQQKILMGAGEGGRIRKTYRKRQLGGYLSDEEEGGVMAGVSAGKRHRKKVTKTKVTKTKVTKKTKGGVSAGNKWIDHVKAYQKKHNCSYTEALKKAGASYK